MDPFTQRMLEKAEQRSRALGISNASKLATQQLQQPQKQQQLPLHSPAVAATPTTHASTNTGCMNKLQVVEKAKLETTTSNGSPKKVFRQFSAVDKENMDLGIEINITTDKNIEVQVEVEEQDVTDDEDNDAVTHAHKQVHSNEAVDLPIAQLRDTSRNRLQRLGALYSNTADLSSPIHRTEGQFHEDPNEDLAQAANLKKPKQRNCKLADLANSINQWEDDTTHYQYHAKADAVPPPKPDLPSRRMMATEIAITPKKVKAPAPLPPTATTIPTTTTTTKTTTVTTKETKIVTAQVMDESEENDKSGNKTKQLKWDPKVINSLEAQGFQRRESSTVKLAYDYGEDKTDEHSITVTKVSEDKPTFAKLTSKFVTTTSTAIEEPNAEKKVRTVKPGLVSGRAAVFEQKAGLSQQAQRPQKDPTELSLKERMQLFEKNKGEALVPKAAFGMAPSISKIRQELVGKREEIKVPTSTSASSSNTSIASVKINTESNVRDKVAALVASATTISENQIKADIHKQRQEDMQLLANRFHKQKDIFAKEQQKQNEPATKSSGTIIPTAASTSAGSCNIKRPPPPPPPPMPTTKATITPQQQVHSTLSSTKRRSPGDAIDDEESKRARTTRTTTTTNRLYPTLSDFNSHNEETETDNDNCATTATISEEEQKQQQSKQTRCSHGVTSAAAAATNEDDDDADDSYMESDADDSSAGICNGSLGREIMQVVQKNEHQQQQQQQQTKQIKGVRYADTEYYFGGAGGGDSSINSSETSIGGGIDDYLDEALEDDDGDDDYTQESAEDDEADTSRASRGSKGTTTSNSFSFRKTTRKVINCGRIDEEQLNYDDDYNTPTTSANTVTCTSQPVKSELSVNQEDENMVTLVHTVSIYRRQQNANSANSTPVRKISREQKVLRSAVGGAAQAVLQFETPQKNLCSNNVDSIDNGVDAAAATVLSPHSSDDEAHLVKQKISKLLDEVSKQQQIIAQTSQALNLCAATIEFSGSTESVEGERHLLVATHRRQVCLDEVQRLHVEKNLRPVGTPKDKGCLTVKEITVPLRQDYIRKLAADTISGHHLVCLLKYNEYVLATKTVPTLPGLLAVKFPDVLQLNNVHADFRITLEIYGMTAQREVLPHEVKYHINLNKKSGIKTPKKKASDNRLVMPPVQSPAGPHVVRTPALVQYGFAIFSLREIQRTSWTLTQLLGVSPLDGVVHMKVNCELSVSMEYRGFLTMYEDISGFGAWHRRWCHLNGTVLNYWKYPDDEKHKTPIGTIDLHTCVSQKIALAPRDICARLNTLLLECQRTAKDTDQESLVIVPNGHLTTVRHLLSADTKEEREEWCAYLNKALVLLRAWRTQL